MAPNQDKLKKLEEYVNSLPLGKEKDLWNKVLEETKRFEAMSDAEARAELDQSKKDAALTEERLKLLEMDETGRKKEMERRQEEAKRKKEAAEKEWEEAAAGAAIILTEEDAARRKAEAEATKSVTAEKTEDLIENFKTFLAKGDLAGCGAVLKKLAVSGRVGEVLNYYGYPSSVAGLHQFFNEIVIGQRPILGERAFDNFLFQQKAHGIEHEISSLVLDLNQWSLAFAMGRKKRAWYQLDEKEHLLAILWAMKKIKPEVAAKSFGRLAYGSDAPREKFNLAAGSDFEFGREGKVILMLFADVLEKQLAKNEFNPEAAEVLSTNVDELEAMGVKSSFIKTLRKYVEGLKIKPEMADEVEEEFKK